MNDFTDITQSPQYIRIIEREELQDGSFFAKVEASIPLLFGDLISDDKHQLWAIGKTREDGFTQICDATGHNTYPLYLFDDFNRELNKDLHQ